MNTITRIYVRRYRDSGQVTAYVDWSDGSRTAGNLYWSPRKHLVHAFSFGIHLHELFKRAKREGLKLKRETW